MAHNMDSNLIRAFLMDMGSHYNHENNLCIHKFENFISFFQRWMSFFSEEITVVNFTRITVKGFPPQQLGRAKQEFTENLALSAINRVNRPVRLET